MSRTRSFISGGRGEAILKVAVEAPIRGRGRDRDTGRGRGRGHAQGAAPVRGHSREALPDPRVEAD